MRTIFYFFSFFVSILLYSCFSLPCDSEPKDVNSNTRVVNKKISIHNKTNTFYKNNSVYFVSLQKEVATGKYVLLAHLELGEYEPKELRWDYSLEDIPPNANATKQGLGIYNYFFYSWSRSYESYARGRKTDIFADTDHTFYLLLLNGGKRKVFFAPYKFKKNGFNFYLFYRSDEYLSEDGNCYHYYKHRDIFLKDTNITLEKNKATSNHKVVTEVIVDGKKMSLEALTMKKFFIDYNNNFLRVEDF